MYGSMEVLVGPERAIGAACADEATEEVTLTVLHPAAEKKDLYASARRRVASCQ